MGNYTMWIIIGLLALSYMQYTFPEKVNPWIGRVWDKVNEFVKVKPTLSCGTEESPVCGGTNVTYKNVCYAQLAGVTNAKAGAC